jgi:hypothetical protein
MAKGARASTKKANHQKLKARVFGPVEDARTERLSAKLLELASQPKPVKEDAPMDGEGEIQSTPYVLILTIPRSHRRWRISPGPRDQGDRG